MARRDDFALAAVIVWQVIVGRTHNEVTEPLWVVRAEAVEIIADRKAVVRLGHIEGFGQITTFGPDGETMATISANPPEGHGVITTYGPDGNHLVRLTGNGGQPLGGLVLTLAGGMPRTGIGTGEAGRSGMVLFDDQGRFRAVWSGNER